MAVHQTICGATDSEACVCQGRLSQRTSGVYVLPGTPEIDKGKLQVAEKPLYFRQELALFRACQGNIAHSTIYAAFVEVIA